MYLRLPIKKNQVHKILHDPLLKNSFFLLISSASSAVFGFAFWVIAAKFYSQSDVGVATALISSMGLIILLSRFGIDYSLIRFFPSGEKSRIFNTSIIVTSICTLIISILYIFGIDFFSPKLNILSNSTNALIFIIYLIANSICVMTNNSFIAIRQAKHQLLQSLLIGSRVFFLIPFITFGAIGIFNAIGISFILTMAISIYLIIKFNIKVYFTIDNSFLKDTFSYSAGNYIASIFITAPSCLFPIMVLNILGAERGACYYITYLICGILFMVPNAISMSLFVEGSHGESLKAASIKSLMVTLAILIPASIILYVFASFILSLWGADYASEGVELFRLMILASFFVSFNSIFNSIQRIQKDLRGIIFINGLVFALIIGFGYLFMIKYGVVGIGYAWLISYFVGSIVFVLIFGRRTWW